jgi:A/G-specific adenine glycosylase
MADRQHPIKKGLAASRNAGAPAVPSEAADAIGAWFPDAARDLPWRRRRNGYHALVSELMLQQTQVARVVEKFGPFVRRFPTAAALAAAPEDEVLAAWQGLGYYRRARLLHAAAKALVERHGGRVPAGDHAALLALPGVGRYTAGAIASTAT